MTDILYMKRALYLAAKGEGSVSPNPMVGALLVYNNKIIGEGYHHRCGEPHAEVNAIKSVKESDKKLIPLSTMYVTLEPCCHHGKTPPCTSLILENGIKKVVVAMLDPFHKVSGGGVDVLRRNGVQVEVGVMEQEAEYLNRRFLTFHRKKRPYIILKWAETADGYIDSKREPSTPPSWLTGDVARVLVHRCRAAEDAIMVGTNTVLRDNPSLTTRYWRGKNPVRVTVDRRGELNDGFKIFDSSAASICYKEHSLEEILDNLYSRNIQSVIVEGGRELLQRFIDARLFDEVMQFRSVKTLSDLNGGSLGGVAAPKLDAVRLIYRKNIGNNILDIFEKSNIQKHQ